MTQAEKIVEKGSVPKDWNENVEEVSAACKRAFEAKENAPEDDPIHQVHENHGLHAYMYQHCDDGSVVAIWANTPSGDVNLKAFSSAEEASNWSPRDER